MSLQLPQYLILMNLLPNQCKKENKITMRGHAQGVRLKSQFDKMIKKKKKGKKQQNQEN